MLLPEGAGDSEATLGESEGDKNSWPPQPGTGGAASEEAVVHSCSGGASAASEVAAVALVSASKAAVVALQVSVVVVYVQYTMPDTFFPAFRD